MTSFGKIHGMAAARRASLMRFPRLALGSIASIASIAVLLVACGGGVEATPAGPAASGSAPSPGSASAGSAGTGSAVSSGSGTGVTGPDQILGQLLVTTEAFQGQLLETFAADLQHLPPPTTKGCQAAIAVVGACCVFPPIAPIPTPLPGSGTGTPNVGTSAGMLALLDATSSASIGTFDFGSGGYKGLPASYYATRWQPGDILTVSATGDQIGVFTVSAPALSPPIMQFPSSFVATENLKITWQPDPNAATMMIQILDNDARSVDIACSAPDSDGTVTVDASLFAAFKPGDFCEVSADRETVRYAQTPTGRVALKSFGYSASVSAKVR